MGVVYQLTFFLALGLLAVVITVFVFAISLLGRAMEAAAKSEQEKLAERRENNAKEMAAIRKEIRKAERNGQIPRGLRRRLQKLEKRDKKFEQELSKIRKAPKLLTVRGGVVPCASCLLGALVLSGGAWYLYDIQIPSAVIHVVIWGVGLVAIGYTISHIYQCLRVIESVAITSEEAALKRTVEAFKIAQKELEEEKRPELVLEWEDEQPPFHVKAHSEMVLKFTVSLVKGEVADNVVVGFYTPSGFSFPGRRIVTQDTDHPVAPGFFTCRVDYDDPIMRGMCIPEELVVKAPPTAGRVEAYYTLNCRGFGGEFKKFEIVVE